MEFRVHDGANSSGSRRRDNSKILDCDEEIGSVFKKFWCVLETSAKSFTNVEAAFMAMTAEIKIRMASQPAMNNARPATVQIRVQPVNQKLGCCSS